MVKGIRVNALAKELGYQSKDLLDRCRAEGLAVPNHMTVLSAGREATLREWFPPQGGGGVATAGAPSPAESTGKKSTRSRRKKGDEETNHDGEHGDEHHDDATHEAATKSSTAHPYHEEITPVMLSVNAPAPAMPGLPPEVAPTVPFTPDPETAPIAAVVPVPPVASLMPPVEEEIPPAPSAEAPAVSVEQPVSTEPPAVIGAPLVPPTPPPLRPQPIDRASQMRPTVRLEDRLNNVGSGPVTPRAPVTVAPQLRTLEPAKIQGPRVVREEKPDVVSAPRPRPGTRPGDSPAGGPSFVQARAQTGRGVKVTTEETPDEEGERKKVAGGAAAKGTGRSNSGRRRGGINGRSAEADLKIREFSEQDLAERRRRIAESAKHRTEFDKHLDKAGHRGQHAIAKTAVEKGEPVEVEEPVTVRNLAAALGVKGSDLLAKLIKQGIFLTINHTLETDVAETLALDYGLELHIKKEATQEEILQTEVAARPREQGDLVTRPPVVTILGHVDHGKTSLLDKIRNANVAAGESGGITQHTAAWMVALGEGDTAKRVTFIDTPGHQAFTSMRARGANMTDVVVLVVAAVEGVMPQSIESMNHARAAGVPIVVAMNKIDRPDANPDMVLGQLAANGLNPVEWGGDTEVIRTSAVTGQGIPELIEILDYQSQLLELKSDPTAPARGTVIESTVDAGLGPVATVLVQDGTLRIGDVLLSGAGYGRIRGLYNDRLKSIPQAGPSTPVIVSGLNELPNAGDKFYVVENIDRARTVAQERQSRLRQEVLASKSKVTLDALFQTMKEGQSKIINVVIKADVQGSVETLSRTVTDANTDEVKVRVIHAAVGGITESDVELADASEAVIIGFHVVPEESARAMAEQRRVEVRLYEVIYDIFDDLKKALSGMLEPEIREKLHGHAEVRQVFKVSKIGNIGGCMITDGHIQRGSRIRLSRNGIVITQDLALSSLKRLKDDVREVKAGLECGIKLDGYDDIKIGDVFEAYIRETIQRTL